jgi:YidC/Oxa1 family membrane protein insertase
MLQPSFFNSVFVFPILNILAAYHYLFMMAKIPGVLGFSIMALTVTIRLLLHPFFKQQMDTARKMQELKPHLDRVAKKHKGDSKKMQEEQMKIYQEAGINPASGCLFMVVQIPVFIALYQTLQYFLLPDTAKVIAAINKALYFPVLHFKTLDASFFGLNLAKTPQQLGIVFMIIIPVLTAVLQYFQTMTTMAMSPQPVARRRKKRTRNGRRFSESNEYSDEVCVSSYDWMVCAPYAGGPCPLLEYIFGL